MDGHSGHLKGEIGQHDYGYKQYNMNMNNIVTNIDPLIDMPLKDQDFWKEVGYILPYESLIVCWHEHY